MDAGNDFISVVVVTYESASPLRRFLQSLQDKAVEIIVVDNSRTNSCAEVASDFKLRFIKCEKNVGYGTAVNIGVTAATHDFVLICNADLEFLADTLDQFRMAAARYPGFGILAPRIIEQDGRLFFRKQSVLATFLKNEPGNSCTPEGDCCTPFLSGACMLMRRDAFLAIGGFDENIFLFYEDDDLCRRFSDKGLPLIHIHESIILHQRGQSSPVNFKSVFRARYYLSYSLLYITRKWKVQSGVTKPASWAALKLIPAVVFLQRMRVARYLGTISGVAGFYIGRSRPPFKHRKVEPQARH